MKKALKIVGAVVAVAALGFCGLVAYCVIDDEMAYKATNDFLQAIVQQDQAAVAETYSGSEIIGATQTETLDNLYSLDGTATYGQKETKAANIIVDKMCDFDFHVGKITSDGGMLQVTVDFTTYNLGLAYSAGSVQYYADVVSGNYKDVRLYMAPEFQKLTEKDQQTTTTLT